MPKILNSVSHYEYNNRKLLQNLIHFYIIYHKGGIMKKAKQKNLLDYILLGSSALFGILTLVIMVAPGIIIDLGLVTTKYNVYELLNYADEARVGLIFALIFSIILLVATLLLLLLKLLNKKFKLELIVALCASALALVAGILFFCTKPLIGEANSSVVSLGIGAILAGIFALISAITLGFYAVKKLIK